MKIAVPTRDGHVDDHFGHCDHYTIYTIENKQILSRENLPSPQSIQNSYQVKTLFIYGEITYTDKS